MTELEKVKKGFERCLSGKMPFGCGKCPYYGDEEYNDAWSCRLSLMRDARELLKEQETANLYKCPNCGTWVSAENVVRCKDCKHLSSPANGVPFCKHIKNFVDADWFCADGEQK